MSGVDHLSSVLFISLPESFSLAVQDKNFTFDPAIPLPVQCSAEQNALSFDISSLTQEMILSGILAICAYDVSNEHISYYRKLLTAVRPGIQQELTEAAILKARNKDFDIAEEIFAALRGLDPDNSATLLNSALLFDERADSYRKSGLHEDADAYDASAHQYYKQVLAADPPIPDAFFNAGFFYLKQRNFLRGKEYFETYLSLTDGGNEEDADENLRYKKERAAEIIQDIENRNLDDELFKSAFDCISMEKEAEGIEKIRQFIKKNPGVWNAWFMLGWGLRKLERWSDAKEAFLQAISCGGHTADTCNELAICLMELGEYDEAKKYLYEALAMEPDNTKIMSNLGFLALKQDDDAEARKFFNTVLEYNPKDKIAAAALENMR
ncbi:MAG: tetratricopeptide repeat protein [Bacteroides sp.]|nr:tetratricopeptide repeat protein [Prevotella sp.]MCM1407140.1 tetratricopeptide repeat protein [Treponema brennaborense]MCM1470292.1 tetratricopeptide repeat protein [Bacteroides sp.]